MQVTDSIFWNPYEHSVDGKFHITVLARLAGKFTVTTSLCDMGGDNFLPWPDLQNHYSKDAQATLRDIEIFVCRRCAKYLDLREGAVKLPVLDAKGRRKLVRHKLAIEADTKDWAWVPEEHWDKVQTAP